MAEDKEIKKEKRKSRVNVNTGGSGIYGLGVIGAAFYYIQHAPTFWIGVIGIIKAFFWPAILIYKVFTLLHL